MDNKFKAIGVKDSIIEAIGEMGFIEPTKVQSESIPYVLEQKDLIVMSKTGSGKTGAFGIGMIQNIDASVQEVQGLVLTPTRELAVQVDNELKKMSKNEGIKTGAVYGQHNINTEINEIKNGLGIVTGTPGRVYDHITSKTLKTGAIKYLVLDEADRMLDMGFFDQVVKIIKRLPRNRVTLLFSATMPPEIQRICHSYMNDPITLELGSDTKTVDTIKQIYYRIEKNEKRMQLDRLLRLEEPESAIIFSNTRTEVDRIVKYLAGKGYDIGALHGGNAQTKRLRMMDKFKDGKMQVIVATDVAARGIHIDDLSLVINYDVPQDKDSYIHRIGRTGRVGNSGKALTFVTVDDIFDMYAIEEHVGALIEEQPLPTDEEIEAVETNSENPWTLKRKQRIENNDFIRVEGEKREPHKNKHNKNKKLVKHHDSAKNKPDKDKKHHGTSKKQHVPGDKHHVAGKKHHKVEDKLHVAATPKPKTERKVIDYRAEAQKFMAKQEKPSILSRIKSLFK